MPDESTQPVNTKDISTLPETTETTATTETKSEVSLPGPPNTENTDEKNSITEDTESNTNTEQSVSSKPQVKDSTNEITGKEGINIPLNPDNETEEVNSQVNDGNQQDKENNSTIRPENHSENHTYLDASVEKESSSVKTGSNKDYANLPFSKTTIESQKGGNEKLLPDTGTMINIFPLIGGLSVMGGIILKKKRND